jgi:PiT family inorganic phosphate transporter
VKNFSGKGLVPDDLIQHPIFAISIALGAGFTVLLATKIGMPTSTTHGLVGALFGAGVVAIGTNFNFEKLGKVFLIPLILSPLMAAVLSFIAYLVLKRLRKQLGITSQKLLDTLHFSSAGIVSFARGLNDTPKIVGLLIIIDAIDIKWGMIAVAVTMAVGRLLNAKKVGVIMSKKITPMKHGQGFTANIITGLRNNGKYSRLTRLYHARLCWVYFWNRHCN